jgi:hypothetical protein
MVVRLLIASGLALPRLASSGIASAKHFAAHYRGWGYYGGHHYGRGYYGRSIWPWLLWSLLWPRPRSMVVALLVTADFPRRFSRSTTSGHASD